MIRRDAAEYVEASYTPDFGSSDSPRALLAEEIAIVCRRTPPPRTPADVERLAFACVLRALRLLSDAGRLQDAIAETGPVNDRRITLAAVVGEIIHSRTPAMTARCADFAFDLGITGESETDIASRFGVGRAAVSAVCCMFRSMHRDGKPGLRMKDQAAVRKYRAGMLGKRARKATAHPWPFADRFHERTTTHTTNGGRDRGA